MTKPVRLQLSRRKGFNLQALSQETNGLPAVNVARPSRWGNPYRPAASFTVIDCVEAYRYNIEAAHRNWQSAREAVSELRGKNLACWCKPGAPCHADVLLEIANRGE